MTDLLERVGEMSAVRDLGNTQQMGLGEACADYNLALIRMSVGAIALASLEKTAPALPSSSMTVPSTKPHNTEKVFADTFFREAWDIVPKPGNAPHIEVSSTRLALNRRILP